VFVTDPTTALTLAKIKAGTGTIAPLLGQDAPQAGERRILGVTLLTSASVAAGLVWAYDRSRVWTVLREDVTLNVDASRYFESDSGRDPRDDAGRLRVRAAAVRRQDHGGVVMADDTDKMTVSTAGPFSSTASNTAAARSSTCPPTSPSTGPSGAGPASWQDKPRPRRTR
jgi:hypothetical protein